MIKEFEMNLQSMHGAAVFMSHAEVDQLCQGLKGVGITVGGVTAVVLEASGRGWADGDFPTIRIKAEVAA